MVTTPLAWHGWAGDSGAMATRTLDREAFRRCLALEPWEQDEIGEDIPDSEWTTTAGEVLALVSPLDPADGA